jgi:hypothetical protein
MDVGKKVTDTTVLYLTPNVQDESFEGKIRANIIRNKGDLPLISVSQKPIDFGENICVGDVGRSFHNIFRQMLIGLEHIKTTFFFITESDCLYPPDYFQFVPLERHHTYSYGLIWLLWPRRATYFLKGYGEAAQVYDTEDWVERITKVMEGRPMWMPDFSVPFPAVRDRPKAQYSWTGNPVIHFRTQWRSCRKTPMTKKRAKTLPYWGDARKLLSEML